MYKFQEYTYNMIMPLAAMIDRTYQFSAHQLLHQHTTDRQKDMFEFEIKHLQNRTLK